MRPVQADGVELFQVQLTSAFHGTSCLADRDPDMNSFLQIHLDKPSRTLSHTSADASIASHHSLERRIFRTALHLLVAGTVLWSLAVFAMVL